MSAPKPVYRIEGFDEDGNAKAFVATDATTTLHFDASFIVAANTSVTPNRIEVSSRVNAATLAILLERFELTSTGLKIKNSLGQTCIEVGADNGFPLVGLYGGDPQPQQGVSLASETLFTDLLGALQSSGIITVGP